MTWSRGYKTFFMLISADCWHFNIYQQDKLQDLMISINLGYFGIDKEFKFYAQLI